MTQQNKSAASLILNGLDNSDITLMSPKEPHFSKQNMSEAIVQLAPFLSPTPSYQDKKSFDYTKYSIEESTKKVIAKFMEEIVMNGVISSFEMILLVVESIKRSGDGLKKAMFRLDEKTQSSAGKFVFMKWLSYAINRIEERQKCRDILVAGESRVEEMIAANIMELICSFTVINKEKQLDVLKNKFGVDWVSIVQQVSITHDLIVIGLCTSLDVYLTRDFIWVQTSVFAAAYKIIPLLDSCKKAQNYLKCVNEKEGKVLPYKLGAMPKIVLPSSIQVNPAPLQAKIPVRKPAVVQHQRQKAPVQALVVDLTQDSAAPAGPIKTPKKVTSTNSIAGNSSSNYKSTHINSAQETQFRQEQSTSAKPKAKINNGRWKDGSFSGSSSNFSCGGWGDYSKEGMNSSKEVVSKPTSSLNTGGREKSDKEGTSSSKEVVSKPKSDFSTGGWENYNETSTPRIASNDRAGHEPTPSLSGRGRDSDKSQYDGGSKDQTPRENQWSGNNVRQFERKRSDRDLNNDNDHRFKRSRTADMGDSDKSKGSLGRGRGRTAPAWMTNGSQPGGTTIVNSDRDRGDNVERSSQPIVSGSMNGSNSFSRGNDSSSLGRGRGRTTPAWITNGSQPGGTTIVNSDRERRDNVERSSQPIVSGGMNGFTSSSQETLGRGRGRGRTTPAWMTTKSADVTTAATNGGIVSSQVTISQSALHTPNIAAPRDYERPSYQHQNVSSGTGRDRGRNVPAWEAKEDQSGASNAGQFDRRSQSLNTGMAGGGNGTESSFGRGRGRTTPAWMTENNSAGPVTSTERNRADASNTFPRQTNSTAQGQGRDLPGGLNGRGRGRGKNQTLPSWMTKSA